MCGVRQAGTLRLGLFGVIITLCGVRQARTLRPGLFGVITPLCGVRQARTLRLGLFGLAVNRFSNLPYQNWSYAPTGPASAELTIAAAVASVRMTVQVCM